MCICGEGNLAITLFHLRKVFGDDCGKYEYIETGSTRQYISAFTIALIMRGIQDNNTLMWLEKAAIDHSTLVASQRTNPSFEKMRCLLGDALPCTAAKQCHERAGLVFNSRMAVRMRRGTRIAIHVVGLLFRRLGQTLKMEATWLEQKTPFAGAR